MTENPQETQTEHSGEPSVLDYIRSRLSPHRHAAIEIPAAEPRPLHGPELPRASVENPAEIGAKEAVLAGWPWRSLVALGLGLLAQSLYEPPGTHAVAGSFLYVLAVGFLAWSAVRGEWSLPNIPADVPGSDPLSYRRGALIAAIPLAVLAFLFFGGNLYTPFNVLVWVSAVSLLVWSLWLRDPKKPSIWERLRLFLGGRGWEIRVDRWALLVLGAALLVTFFRFYHIQLTPAEPFSDHAEKLLDIYDISQGQTRIFFPRNTGREDFQMYWSLLTSWVFGTGLSFLTLKIGTALNGLLTLPFVYLLGKEVASRRVGLLALILTGVGYWPNLVARIGLRFPLYPMFVAPLMYFLIRGMRRRNRNDFILAGICLGLGLHGYSPFRIVPLLVVVAIVLYMLHAQSKGVRWKSVVWLAIAAVVSLLVFLPLLRYATEHPDSFSYRALTRLEGIEQPLPGPAPLVFLSNTWNALRMFNWNNGNIWVHSVPNRPALDVVMGVLFLLGAVLLVIRYAQRRHWLDLFLLLSVPILLLPSILSLAFPDENPSLNRTGAAFVPVFLIGALALDGLIRAFGSGRGRSVMAYSLTAVLLWASASQSFDLVFHQFDQDFRQNSWNSSEMGAVIKGFGEVYGETETAWVVPFPYWVDTRLVGVWAGIPNRDFAVWPDQLAQTQQVPGPKLFIAKASLTDPAANDQKTIDTLMQLYPDGAVSLHRSAVPGHDFWVFLVPAPAKP
ncbi:MAG: ArnT family glycosyltransferase [Anaerolineales bacterium]